MKNLNTSVEKSELKKRTPLLFTFHKGVDIRLLLSLALSFLAMASLASVTVDGIKYDLNGDEAAVVGSDNDRIIIPASIVYKGKSYTVTEIGRKYEWLFGDYNKIFEISVISIPNSIKKIHCGTFYYSKIDKVIVSDLKAWCKIDFDAHEVISGGNGNPLLYSHHLFSDENTEIKDLVIPEGVEEISAGAFTGCSGIESITLPKTLKTICFDAFRGCAVGSTLTIPSSVTTIYTYAFDGPKTIMLNGNVDFRGDWFQASWPFNTDHIAYIFGKNVEEIIYGKDVTVMKPVSNMPRLKKVSILGVIEDIDVYGDSLVSINIPSGAKSVRIGSTMLESINIPNGVNAVCFNGCKALKGIVLPNSVNTLYDNAFKDCLSLSYISLPPLITELPYCAFSGCENLAAVNLPEELTSIGNAAFMNCTSLSSISLPEKLSSIFGSAFSGCTRLSSIRIPSSLQEVGNQAFEGCSNLLSVFIDSEILVAANRQSKASLLTIFGPQVIHYCLNDPIRKLGDNTFYGCTAMTDISLPSSLDSIGANVFYNCKGLESIILPDNISRIANGAFMGCTDKLYVKIGSKTLLALWNANYSPYQEETTNLLPAPTLQFKQATQTTITFIVTPYYDAYQHAYRYGWGSFKDCTDSVTITSLKPDENYSVEMRLSQDDMTYTISDRMKSASLNPTIKKTKSSASSLSIACSYIEGDAVVAKEEVRINGETIEGVDVFFSGLDPGTSYTVYYMLEGVSEDGSKWNLSTQQSISTDRLSLLTLQPKVINEGNVIVAAQSNVDDEETNVGFEWRRTDWSDEFPSNTGTAYLYEGKIEGYIRNLNTNFLFKFRPYYLSDSGTYYYGDWMGLDPTNTSYFEPTVHTYASITVEGNTALVKGYALRGTDNVSVQGFKYWKDNSSANIRYAPALPEQAMTVEASGQVMTAKLTGLDYESSYCYVAFVTTTEGETFYGETQRFTTGEDTTGIPEVVQDSEGQQPVTLVARYNISGKRITSPEHGLNILLFSDGSVRKVYVR